MRGKSSVAAAVTAAALVAPLALAGARSDVFTDVPSTAADHDAINRVYNAGIMKPCNTSPMQFCPNGNLLRRGAAVQYDRLLGLDGTPRPFTPTFQAVNIGGASNSIDTVGAGIELRVMGIQALRLEGNPNTPNVIGGGAGNSVPPWAAGATIAGGGGGLGSNSVTGSFGTVGGGLGNSASDYGTVAGGFSNAVRGRYGAVGGGFGNTAGGSGAVGGGTGNSAIGQESAVPGGAYNLADGTLSLAAGRRAQAKHQGAFVWADSQDADFASTAADQFDVRAAGGVRIVRGGTTFNPTGAALQVESNGTNGEAAWLWQKDANALFPVAALLKEPTSSAAFLACVTYDGVTTKQLCHINPLGTFVAGSDFAEALPAVEKASYGPGDVLVASRTHPGAVERSRKANDPAILGVYSTRPAVLGADKGGVTRVAASDVPLAIAGVVPVKVSAENGSIGPGDQLVSASSPGRAMKAPADPRSGTVLGKALGVLPSGSGTIKVLVMVR